MQRCRRDRPASVEDFPEPASPRVSPKPDERSQENLARKVEEFVNLWRGIEGNRSIYEERRFGLGALLKKIPDSAVPRLEYDDTSRHRGRNVLARTIEILADEIFLEDIRSVVAWSDVIASVEAARRACDNDRAANEAFDRVQERLDRHHKRAVELYVIAPRRWFDPSAEDGDLSPSTKFCPKLIADAISQGADVAADESQWRVRPDGLPEPCADEPAPSPV